MIETLPILNIYPYLNHVKFADLFTLRSQVEKCCDLLSRMHDETKCGFYNSYFSELWHLVDRLRDKTFFVCFGEEEKVQKLHAYRSTKLTLAEIVNMVKAFDDIVKKIELAGDEKDTEDRLKDLYEAVYTAFCNIESTISGTAPTVPMTLVLS